MQVASQRIIREAEVRDLTGLPRQTRLHLEQEGKFPKRIQLGARAVGWVESEVADWLARVVAARES